MVIVSDLKVQVNRLVLAVTALEICQMSCVILVKKNKQNPHPGRETTGSSVVKALGY